MSPKIPMQFRALSRSSYRDQGAYDLAVAKQQILEQIGGPVDGEPDRIWQQRMGVIFGTLDPYLKNGQKFDINKFWNENNHLRPHNQPAHSEWKRQEAITAQYNSMPARLTRLGENISSTARGIIEGLRETVVKIRNTIVDHPISTIMGTAISSGATMGLVTAGPLGALAGAGTGALIGGSTVGIRAVLDTLSR